MNKLIKTTIAVLLLTAIPMKQWAQTPYRPYADEGIVLNFFEIDNYDFRLFLLYNLNQDDRFIVTPEEQFGMFNLIPSSDRQDDSFLDTFETFYNNTSADFRLIDKVDLEGLVIQWKEGVPPAYFASITMDLAFDRSITINNHCVDSDPFCTSDVIQFQAASTSQTADELESDDFDDGCIGSSFNPSWYHMRINTPGQFIIHMEGHDPNTNEERDIDYCIWGPFDDPIAPCVRQLTTNKIIDCNYSAHYSEDIYLGFREDEHHHQASHGTINYHMPETGEYYILMICNFSRQPCVITFTKAEDSGPGTTDCGILPGIVTNSGPYCVGETIRLSVTTQAGATYSWTGPNGFTSNEQNPSIPNCTYEMGGTYTCITAVDGQTTTGHTDVVVFAEPVADFIFDNVCEGNTTQLTSTAATEPAGHEIENYHWDFGDGETSDEPNVTHTYAAAGEYQVTHTVKNGRGRCTDEITKTVVVYAQPVAFAGEDQSLPYPGLSTQLSGSGGSDTFSYHWEPANMVVNPNSRNTETVILMDTQQYVLTVTNPQGDCISIDTMYVYIGTAPLNVDATASPDALCLGESTQLHVNADGGSGDFTYSWSPTDYLNSSHISTPIATPLQTITYTCTVTDNVTTEVKRKTVTVTVNMPQYLSDSIIREQCDTVRITWRDGQNNEQYAEFHENGFIKFVGLTEAGCHREQTYYIEDMQYTPDPLIYDSIDSNPQYPITATEFNVNRYTYRVTDNTSDISRWHLDECEWKLDKDSWRIITDENDPLQCIVYAMEWVPDSILLSFIAVNECGSDTAKYWLHPSFYGVEENEAYPASVSIIPNPNNGHMQLKFENMEGCLSIKVYNSTGILVDSFEIQSSYGETYDYSAKRLNNGIYFFNITDGKRAVTKKVVIIN